MAEKGINISKLQPLSVITAPLRQTAFQLKSSMSPSCLVDSSWHPIARPTVLQNIQSHLAIERNVESADVSAIMREIQNVVDERFGKHGSGTNV